mmetsp:Transcript_17225/g.50153  ORF Transcript_17225/g.50153 Transcript_17225/m.50153 type:complete len:260 (-) Transcript_17225:794-1573(-)
MAQECREELLIGDKLFYGGSHHDSHVVRNDLAEIIQGQLGGLASAVEADKQALRGAVVGDAQSHCHLVQVILIHHTARLHRRHGMEGLVQAKTDLVSHCCARIQSAFSLNQRTEPLLYRMPRTAQRSQDVLHVLNPGFEEAMTAELAGGLGHAAASHPEDPPLATGARLPVKAQLFRCGERWQGHQALDHDHELVVLDSRIQILDGEVKVAGPMGGGRGRRGSCFLRRRWRLCDAKPIGLELQLEFDADLKVASNVVGL